MNSQQATESTELELPAPTKATPGRHAVGTIAYYTHRSTVGSDQLEPFPRPAVVVRSTNGDHEARVDLVTFNFDGIPAIVTHVPWSAEPRHGHWIQRDKDAPIGRMVTVEHVDALVRREPQRRAALVLGENGDGTMRCLIFDPHGERWPGLAPRLEASAVRPVTRGAGAAVGAMGTCWVPPRAFATEHKKCAAIVTFVYSDGTVNLSLWLPDGSYGAEMRCGVSELPTTGFWTPLAGAGR